MRSNLFSTILRYETEEVKVHYFQCKAGDERGITFITASQHPNSKPRLQSM